MKIDVAVTGLNATDNPGPGLGIIRAIRAWPEFQGRIIGLAYDAKEPAIYLGEICDEVYLIPYPSAGIAALSERLNYILARSHLDCVIPSLDSELNGFLALEPELARKNVRTLLPSREMLDSREKRRLGRLCTQAKVGYPKTREISDLTNLSSVAAEIGYPVVIKGVFYEAEVAHTLAELEKAAVSISARWGFPLLAQEFVKGEEFDIALVGDGTGKLQGLTAMRKMQLTTKGKAWGGMTLDAAHIVEIVRKLMRVLKWRGPMEVELKRRDADGKFFLIEMNPRFPAWIYLSHGAGCNLPALLLECMFGRPPKRTVVGRAGTMFLRVAQDHILSIEEYEKMLVSGELIRVKER
ncbi:MAG: ATP-grasp domain-containing protein [Candidatus Riflebacteria bacterium]|nr:ATP-grasp domain-containing protein [Candidatus Riflebacteria bacterium]